MFQQSLAHPSEWKSLRPRVVKLTNENGEESFFLASLLRREFSVEDLREFYHLRWEEEDFFKMAKSAYIGQVQFRSKSASGVIQEIHAQMLFLAISRYLLMQAAEANDCEPEQIQQKGAVLSLAAYVTRIFLGKDPDIAHVLPGFAQAHRKAKLPKERGDPSQGVR